MTPRAYLKGTTSGATASLINLADVPVPMTLQFAPGSGATCTVEISADAVAYSDPANAVWVAWSGGATNNAAAIVHVLGPLVAARITRTAGGTDSTYVVRA